MGILEGKKIQYRLQDKLILKNISFEIEQGEAISIVGSSGSGKSTLLKMMADLLSPTDGELTFDGKSYGSYEAEELRRMVSYCVQSATLFGQTVRENLEFPYVIRDVSPDEAHIIDWLEKVGLSKEFLEKDIYRLSGGEKQRIALVRTLLYRPKILLLDEATSALDYASAVMIEQVIAQENSQGVTVLWITHDMNQSVGIFNRRITMEDGEIKQVEELG